LPAVQRPFKGQFAEIYRQLNRFQGSLVTMLIATNPWGIKTRPFNVFAPTDDAFAKIPKTDLDAPLKDKAKLKSVLTYHVV